LRELQEEVLKPDAIESVIQTLGRQLADAFERMSSELVEMRDRKTKTEAELRRLAETAARTGPSGFLIEAINQREKQLRDITERLLSTGPAWLATPASAEQSKKHVEKICITPQYGSGKPYYLAEGAWSLLGNEKGPAHNTAPLPDGCGSDLN